MKINNNIIVSPSASSGGGKTGEAGLSSKLVAENNPLSLLLRGKGEPLPKLLEGSDATSPVLLVCGSFKEATKKYLKVKK